MLAFRITRAILHFILQPKVVYFIVISFDLTHLQFDLKGLEGPMKKLRSMMNDLKIENKRGWTVLHEIVHPKAFKSCNHLKKNRSKYFEILVGGAGSPNNKLPIDVTARDKDGNTLLYYAIVSSNL